MADAIPATLALLFGLVTGLVALMVWVVMRLKRWSILAVRPKGFVPGGSAVMFSSHLFSKSELVRRPKRSSVRPSVMAHCSQVRFDRSGVRLNSRRR